MRKSREEYNEYMRSYMLRRYHKRRAEILLWLGGKCEECGTADNLEIDHIDKTKKTISLGKMWNLKWDSIIEELKKCQLLCTKCHKFKSVSDVGNQHSEGNHGTFACARYCKCIQCLAVKAEHAKNYKKR